MALFYDGTTCSICGKLIQRKEKNIQGLPHCIDNPKDSLYPYSDSIVHENCYTQWSRKQEFEQKILEWEKNHSSIESMDKKHNVLSEEEIRALKRALNEKKHGNSDDGLLSEDDIKELFG